MDKGKVFLSFTTHDVAVTEEVYEYLERHGISCWMSTHSLPGGTDYPSAIVEGIKNCGAFVLVASSYTNNSPHVANELALAFDNGKPILVFKLDDVVFSNSLLYYLNRKHWIEARADFTGGLENLILSLKECSNIVQADCGQKKQTPREREKITIDSPAHSDLSREEIARTLEDLTKKYAYCLNDKLNTAEKYERFYSYAKKLFNILVKGSYRNGSLDPDTDYVALLADKLSEPNCFVRVQGLPGAAKNMLLQLVFHKMLRSFTEGKSNILPIYMSVGYYEKFDYTDENVGEEMGQVIQSDVREYINYIATNKNVVPVLFLEGVREYSFTHTAPEKIIHDIFKPFGKYSRAVSIDVGLIKIRTRIKKVIPIIGDPRDGYLLKFSSVPIEDKQTVKNMIAYVGEIYSEKFDAEKIYELLTKLRYTHVDVFLIRFISHELDILNSSNLSISEMYEKYVLNEYQDEDKLYEVSCALFENIFFGGASEESGNYDGKMWSFPNKHNTYLGYLIAYYFVKQVENYKSLNNYDFFKFMLTATANQFIVSMLKDNYELQKIFVEFIDKKFETFDMRQKCNAAYWLGRMDFSKPIINVAVSMLTSLFAKLKPLVKTNNKNTQENLDNHLLFRSVCTGLLLHGQANMMDEYLCIVITNDIANAVNRGALVEYFGSGYQMGAYNTYYLDTDLERGLSAIKALCTRVEFALYHSKQKFVENNLVSLLTLLQARIQGKTNSLNYDVPFFVNRALKFLETYKQKPQNIASSKILYYFDSVKDDFRRYISEGGFDLGPTIYNKLKGLKYIKRAQWVDKVSETESVCEHMYSSWILAMLFLPEEIAQEGYNKKEILDMMLIHDMAQANREDIISKQSSLAIDLKDQNEFMRKLFLKGTYPDVANLTYFYNIWTGYYNCNNINAKIARDINILQKIYTFFEYCASGEYGYTAEEAEAWLNKKDELNTNIGFEIFERMIEKNSAFTDLIEKARNQCN